MNSRIIRIFLLLLAVASPLPGATSIYPIGAIEDLWNLPADEFRQKYPGINATGLGPSDEGWYVRYRHENLTYLFGPVADREEARKRKWEMETVRDAAIRNRPSLASSQVDFVRFSFTNVFGRGGDGTGSGEGKARMSADGKSGPDGDLDGDGIPNALDNDMDGDGVPNDKDPDVDGDGIPNAQDDYPYGGMDEKLRGSGAEGNLAKAGQEGGGKDGAGGKQASAGKDGREGSGQAGDGASGQPVGAGQQGQQQVAALGQQGQRGAQLPGQNGRMAQSGAQGQPGSQQSSGSGQQSSSSSSQSGQPGSPGSPSGGPPSSSGGSANPIALLQALLKAILGL